MPTAIEEGKESYVRSAMPRRYVIMKRIAFTPVLNAVRALGSGDWKQRRRRGMDMS